MNSPKDRLGILFLSAVIFIFGSFSFNQISLTSQFAQVASLSTGLVSHYSFDDGTATDSVGSVNGTLSGPTLTTGKVGSGALLFNGVSDTVTVSGFTGLQGQSEASISLWIRPDAQNVGVMNQWDSMSRLLNFAILGTSYRPNWRHGGSGTSGTTLDMISTNGTVAVGSWQHVVIIYNKGVSTIYINGVQAASQTAAASQLNTSISAPLVFGYSNLGTAPYFKGALDDVRIYNKSLVAQDVVDLYALGGGTVSTGGSTGGTTGGSIGGSSGTTTTEPPPPQTQTPPQNTVGTFYVSPSGNDLNNGSQSSPWLTVQKCANVAQAGSTCIVMAGNYPEDVQTKFGGTSDSNRIIFKSETKGGAVIKSFSFKHPYVTLENFDITGPTFMYSGYVNVTPTGNYCNVLNNNIRDGSANVNGILIGKSGGVSANNCVIRGNTLRNLRYVFLNVSGGYHLVENNVFEHINSRDYIYLFGHDITIRRNIFRDGNSVIPSGNHPDFIQTFGDNGDESYNMLIEENWIENLGFEATIAENGIAFSQLNSGGIDRGLQSNIHDWVFRRNVIASVSGNSSASLPGLIWENNTFYRQSYLQTGISSGASLTRGDSSRSMFMNNVFFAGGTGAANSNDTTGSGFYGITGASLSREVLGLYVTGEGTNGGSGGPIAVSMQNELQQKGYLVYNGELTNKARAVTTASEITLSSTFEPYRTKLFDALKKTVDLDNTMRSTVAADYNFVAGSAPNYYPKRSDNCFDGIFTPFKYCEAHGINGGNPMLANPNDPDGPDNIPFTTDDGLKPLPGSPLCGKGYNGTDIGAYSCSSGVVFAASSGGFVPPSTQNPPPPSQPRAGDFNGDGRVNSIDFSFMNSRWNTSDTQADLNKDGKVNTLDFAIMSRNWTS